MALASHGKNPDLQISTSSVPGKVKCIGDKCCTETHNEKEIEKDPYITHRTLQTNRGNGSPRLLGHTHQNSNWQQSLASQSTDIEQGSVFLDHLVVKFAGSNCPGCTTKITKALKSMTCISNIRMNQLLLQAEFDLDCTKTSKHDVVESIQRSTGRDCKIVEDKWRDLEIEMLDSSRTFTDSVLPAGTRGAIALGKDAFSIKYDAKIVGARTLLKALSMEMDTTVYLSPPKLNDGVPAELRNLGCMALLSSILTLPILVLAWAPLPKHEFGYGVASLVMATIIQVVIAGPFYPRALRSLFLARVIDMDLLVVLSTSITYGFSVATFICQTKGIELASDVYFETSALLITLIMMGRFIGDLACHRAIQSTTVKSNEQQFATLVDTPDLYARNEKRFDVRLLQYGDILRVQPGWTVVADGTVVSGASEFDESVMTGEPHPVAKYMGSTVIAGAINRGSVVLVQINQLPGENAVDEIARVVEGVMHSKPSTQQIADRIAAWIVPGAGVLALLTLIIWSVVAKLVQSLSAERAMLRAVPYAISVLVVSCPCAIGMAVPIVLMVASAVGTKHGVCFRSAEAMTMARRATHVVFDSTGTLTQKNLSVVTEDYFTNFQALIETVTLALARRSEHPVSISIAKHLETKGVEPASIREYTSIVGSGAEALWNGDIVRIGNAHWLGVETLPEVQTLLSRNLTVLCVSVGGQLLATFGLEAHLRDDASTVVASLIKRGVKVSIVSGNETGAVHKVAANVGIPLSNVLTRSTPIEKQRHIKELMRHPDNVVIFCGDGINDEAALAQASIGVRVGKRSGMMQTAANAFLTGSSLSGLLTLMELSRQCHRQIVFNFTWAIVYNVFAVLFAAGAFVKVRLSPEYAGLGEAVSILPVVLVPMRLWWKKFP